MNFSIIEQLSYTLLKAFLLVIVGASSSYAACSSYKQCLPLAHQGDWEARYYIAETYYEGRDEIGQDFSEAYKWFYGLAEEGNVDAIYAVGLMYSRGEGVEKNLSLAAQWFHKSAKEGNIDAAGKLGVMYYYGEGVPQHYETAYTFLSIDAKAGSPNAQFILATMYEDGLGVSANYKKSEEWYLLAAEQGDISSMVHLGKMYYEGKGTPKDYKKSFKLFEKAAFAGDKEAQGYLAIMYNKGLGVKGDREKARFFEESFDRLPMEKSFNGLGLVNLIPLLLFFIGHFWLAATAFEQNELWGIGVFVFYPLSIFVAIRFWSKTRIPFLLSFLSLMVMLLLFPEGYYSIGGY